MENKYYSPTIEEFHVGFEYEALWGIENIDGEWLKETFNNKSSISSLEEKVRVKLLDIADIKSLGFIELSDNSKFRTASHFSTPKFIGEKDSSIIILEEYCNKVTIKFPNFIRDGSGNFDGYITRVYRIVVQNKSELKKLLTQIGIKYKKPY